MEIRKATPADLKAISMGCEPLWGKTTFSKYQSFNAEKFEDMMFKVMNMPDGCLLVAENEINIAGAVVGYILPNFYDSSQAIARCILIAVFPEYRGLFCYQKLRQQFKAWGEEKGAGLIVYGGYDPKFVKTMKKEGYKQTEVMLVKKIEQEAKE